MYDENLMRYKFADVPGMEPYTMKRKAETNNQRNELRLISKLFDFFKAD